MEFSNVTMLIIGIVVFALGLFLIFDFVPGYEADLSDRVCYLFSLTRGMIFRDKGDYIPNSFEQTAYDALAPFIPLPCKTKTFTLDRSDYSFGQQGDDDFNEEFVRLISTQIIRCSSLFKFGSNNPLYPGGSGRNPFVCSLIVYDFKSSDPPLVRDLMAQIRNFEISSQKSKDEKLKDKISIYHMNSLFEADCSMCNVFWLSPNQDWDPSIVERCSSPACAYGTAVSSASLYSPDNPLRKKGVLYVTYLDFPGKILTRMDMGNRACGFFNIEPKYTQARELKFTEIAFDWDQAKVELDDRILICYEGLYI